MDKTTGLPGKAAFLLFLMVMAICSPEVDAQFSPDVLSVSWGIEKLDPVKVEIDSSREQSVSFIGFNSTFYPFKLKIVFKNVQNLAPRPSSKEMELKHGTNQIITLTVATKGYGFGYEYSYSYGLKSNEGKAELSFPYLVPFKEGVIPDAYGTGSNAWTAIFRAAKGDTVYCMRRGVTISLPGGSQNDFRISPMSTLEVLHSDGTIMAYSSLDMKKSFCSQGKTVLPGQPIGVVSDSSFIRVQLLEFGDENRISFLPIRFATGETTTAFFDGIAGKMATTHPLVVITREMTKSEIKKYGR